jgi:hypothetical protein
VVWSARLDRSCQGVPLACGSCPPSDRHESLAELFRSRPELVGEVLARWPLPVPEYREVRVTSGQFTIKLSERWADVVVTFHDEGGRAVLRW